MKTLYRRIAAAAAILFLPGDRMPVTKRELVQFKREWVEWQITFADILEKLNTWSARMAKREKRALEQTMGALEGAQVEPEHSSRSTKKLELYRRLGGGGMPLPSSPPPPPQEEAG